MKHQIVRLLILIASSQGAAALAQDEYDAREHYNKFEHLIPMRDGVRLFTAVYVPKGHLRNPWPFLMRRTPYSVSPYGSDSYPEVLGPPPGVCPGRVSSLSFQDVRGRFMSEGEFVNVRPYLPVKSVPRDVDENTDTYDTIEWLLENVARAQWTSRDLWHLLSRVTTQPTESLTVTRPSRPLRRRHPWATGSSATTGTIMGPFFSRMPFFFFSRIGQQDQSTPAWCPRPSRPKHLEIQMRGCLPYVPGNGTALQCRSYVFQGR